MECQFCKTLCYGYSETLTWGNNGSEVEVKVACMTCVLALLRLVTAKDEYEVDDIIQEFGSGTQDICKQLLAAVSLIPDSGEFKNLLGVDHEYRR